MTDIAKLESDLLAAIASAKDEAGLEAVRVAALGKSGSVIGAAQDARVDDAGRAQGARPGDQRLEGTRHRRDRFGQGRAWRRRARRAAGHRDRRRHAAGARGAGRDRPRASDQPGDRRAHRHLRRHGLRGRGRSRHRDRRLQLHQAKFPGRPSGAGNARHLLFPDRSPTARGCCCARIPRRCRCAPC